MTAASLTTWVHAHQLQVGVGGAAGVVGLALARRKKTASTAPTTSTIDTTQSDLYNQLQPQLEAIQAALAANAVGANSTVPGTGGSSSFPDPPPPSPTPTTSTNPFMPSTPNSGPAIDPIANNGLADHLNPRNKFALPPGPSVDTGQRGVSSGLPGAGVPTQEFLAFRETQPDSVKAFLDAVGSGKVVVRNGVVTGKV